jgi:hypothetical protein
MSERSTLIRRNRPRGIYVPTAEAQPYIELAGWTVLDDCPGYDEVLLAPPARAEEAA